LEMVDRLCKKKNLKYKNFMKISPVGADLSQSKETTDRHAEAKYLLFAIVL
jgi:hypothetical protein